MTNLKPLRKALLSSVLSIVLCVSMLLGTTFAWFTDSVTSAGNTITTGTLDVQLFEHTGTGENDKREITNSASPLFEGGYDNPNAILWEPGRTEVRYLSIKNNGSLALKYKVVIDVDTENDTNYSLTDVMYYQITRDAKYGEVTAWDKDAENSVEKGKNPAVYAGKDVEDVQLLPGETHYFALSVHMDEDADNNYQGDKMKAITFDVTILAGQLAHENDSFGNEYDEYAAYSGVAYAAPMTGNESAVEVPVTTSSKSDSGEVTDKKIGSIVIPKDAVGNTAEGNKVTMDPTDYNHNVSIASDEATVNYEIKVTNIKFNNTAPLKVQVNLPAGKNPDTVKVYHEGTLIDSTYNPNTGIVSFETTGFSPFLFVYEKNSTYTPPTVDATKLPKAKVEAYTDTANIVWGNYGQWSPTAGLEANLESAYTFSCTETLEQAKKNPYANWNCDFYVKLDRDLGANQIFLGGKYGSFGWVGFHNGDVTLKANEELGLLESVTSNPWTYLDVVQFVGEFVCGVGDVNNALSGATFTVMLRLTNPDNPNEFVNIETIKHTFA